MTRPMGNVGLGSTRRCPRAAMLSLLLVQQLLIPHPAFQAITPVRDKRVVACPHAEAVATSGVNMDFRRHAGLLQREEALDRSLGQFVVVGSGEEDGRQIVLADARLVQLVLASLRAK